MAKRVSPTSIGVFVVASVAILVVAIVVVGSGQLFSKPAKFICMFQGSLNGLKIGAPVKVKGVQIGTVAQIGVQLTPSEGRLRPGVKTFRLPVIIEIDRTQIASLGGSGQALTKKGFDDLIRQGWRAQLNIESFLTGLLYIDLDNHPGSRLDLVIVPGSGPYREIPTVPTTIEAVQEQATKVLARFQDIDPAALASSLTEAADSVRDLAASPDLKATLYSLRDATANLNRTLISMRAAIDNLNGSVGPVMAGLKTNSDQANITLKQAETALVALQSTLAPDSPLAVRLNDALVHFSDATESLQEFTDYLQRNPASLIRGKYVPDKER